jgi:hypothetical protein
LSYASGGLLPPRDDNDDSLLAALDNSYVIPAAAVRRLGLISLAALNLELGER